MKLNMKRVLLALCMVTCLFSLSACSKAAGDTSEVDAMTASSLQQQTVALLESIASIPMDQMDVVIEQNRGNGAEAVAVGLESYLNLYDDMGAYVSAGEGSVAITDGGGYSITIDALYEKRPVSFVVLLDKDMVNITSMSFNPVYTTKEKLAKAGMNTLMGMGTVFCVLIFISLLIACFKFINAWETKNRNKGGAPAAAVPAPVAVPAPAATENLVDDLELVAVITAAIAASENTSADGLVVRSIRRAPISKWKK